MRHVFGQDFWCWDLVLLFIQRTFVTVEQVVNERMLPLKSV